MVLQPARGGSREHARHRSPRAGPEPGQGAGGARSPRPPPSGTPCSASTPTGTSRRESSSRASIRCSSRAASSSSTTTATGKGPGERSTSTSTGSSHALHDAGGPDRSRRPEAGLSPVSALTLGFVGGVPAVMGGGGLEIQIAQTARALEGLGHRVVRLECAAADDGIDVVHGFHAEPALWHWLPHWTRERPPAGRVAGAPGAPRCGGGPSLRGHATPSVVATARVRATSSGPTRTR